MKEEENNCYITIGSKDFKHTQEITREKAVALIIQLANGG